MNNVTFTAYYRRYEERRERFYKLIGRENCAHVIKKVMAYETRKIREIHPVEKIE